MGIMPPERPKTIGGVLALDFETANTSPESACSLGVALIEDGRIARCESALIRPYTGRDFCFTYLHGIAWKDVADKPLFHDVWPQFEPLWSRADLVIAHNVAFDLRVLLSCARRGGIIPTPRWVACTVEMTRLRWPDLQNHKLDTLCTALSIPLNHHEAASDSQACAAIYLAAMKANGRVRIGAIDAWTNVSLPPDARITTRCTVGRKPKPLPTPQPASVTPNVDIPDEPRRRFAPFGLGWLFDFLRGRGG